MLLQQKTTEGSEATDRRPHTERLSLRLSSWLSRDNKTGGTQLCVLCETSEVTFTWFFFFLHKCNTKSLSRVAYLWLWFPACVCRRCAPSCPSSQRPGSTAPEERWRWTWPPFDSLSGCPEKKKNHTHSQVRKGQMMSAITAKMVKDGLRTEEFTDTLN